MQNMHQMTLRDMFHFGFCWSTIENALDFFLANFTFSRKVPCLDLDKTFSDMHQEVSKDKALLKEIVSSANMIGD